MALCVLAGGKTVALAVSAFTLSWTHSVEKITWQENWQVTPAGLELIEARVKGSGAGMEPPEDAVLQDGWWVYRPKVPALNQLQLASSGATSSGWTICAEGNCLSVGDTAGEAVLLEPCGRNG